MEEARRRIKRERKKEKREGENDDGRRKCRTRFRLALLHNFIALSPVFATKKRAKREEGRGGGRRWNRYFIIRWEEFPACEYNCQSAVRAKLT